MSRLSLWAAPRILGRSWPALLALGLLAGCGGGGGSAPVPPVPPPPAARDEVLAASKPGELLSYVKEKLRARRAQFAGLPPGQGGEFTLSAGTVLAGSSTASASGLVARSGTTVQESGVDEDDLIKTDGSTIYALVPRPQVATGQVFAQLRAQARLADGALGPAATLDLLPPAATSAYVHGMLLSTDGRRLAVIGESMSVVFGVPTCVPDPLTLCLLPFAPQSVNSSVLVQPVSVADPANPVAADRITIDGRLIGTRQVGNMLYLVTVHSPVFSYERLPATATDAEREAALAQLRVTDVVPSVRVGSAAAQPLVNETDCYTQAKNASNDLQVTTLTAIDLGSAALTRSSRCFLGGTEALYMSPTSIYLATSRNEVVTQNSLLRYELDAFTDIHKFSTSGAAIDYRASGKVAGHLGWDRAKASYRLSEHNGDLRVLSFTGQTGWFLLSDAVNPTKPASPATLTVLRERSSDASLQVVSTLPNTQRPAPLGQPGEQVYGVRFLGDRAYLVTFRQVDPLYVLDLSNPAEPRAVGELKIPGVSDYLFPLDNGLLLGVGKDATDEGRLGGVKVALFDVANPAQPRELGTQVWGKRGSASGLDYSSHGLNMLTVGGVARVALPLALFDEFTGRFERGLQRIEIDTAARTMLARPLIPSSGITSGDLSADRSVQIGDKLYFLTQGTLSAWNWAP